MDIQEKSPAEFVTKADTSIVLSISTSLKPSWQSKVVSTYSKAVSTNPKKQPG